MFVFSTLVYDVTIGYKHRCPTFLDNVFGLDPSEVHIHVQRIPIHDIPTSQKEVSTWLVNKFHLKDQLLSDFYSGGHFPREGTETELPTVKCLANCITVILFTTASISLTIFSSFWLKIYVSLSCVCLATATHFNVRPVPLLGFVKGMFNRRKLSKYWTIVCEFYDSVLIRKESHICTWFLTMNFIILYLS